MAIKRRSAIIGATAVVATTVGGVAWFTLRTRPPLPDLSAESDLSDNAKDLARLLYDRLEGVHIDGAAYVAFVRDHEAFQGKIRRRKKASSRVVTKFLLSTDFFENGAKERTLSKYKGYYDPYVSVCGNPFTREDET